METTINDLRAVIAEKHLLNHPFYQRWTEGTLPMAVVRKYAEQYYQLETHFPRLLSQIHTHCEDAGIRRSVSDNLYDEEHGEENHQELWLRFGEGIGCQRNEIKTATPLPETRATIEAFQKLCESSVLEGVAALAAYEEQIPEVSESKLKGLRDKYGITDARTTAFFSVHKIADEQHRAVWWDIIERETQTVEERESVRAAIVRARDALWAFLDGICRAYLPAEEGKKLEECVYV